MIQTIEPEAYILNGGMFSDLSKCLSSIIVHPEEWWQWEGFIVKQNCLLQNKIFGGRYQIRKSNLFRLMK